MGIYDIEHPKKDGIRDYRQPVCWLGHVVYGVIAIRG
jgi:hypothetical protein